MWSLKHLFGRKAKRPGNPWRARLSLEALEDRAVPSYIAVEIPRYGLYLHDTNQFSPDNGWKGLLSANYQINKLGVDSNGDVVADIQNYGLWFYHNQRGGQGHWSQLTGLDPTTLAMAASGDVAAAFQGYGTYTFDTSGQARQILGSGAMPSMLGIDNSGDVVGEFPGHGVWYDPQAYLGNGFHQVVGVDATMLAFDEGWVAAYFPGYGLWRADLNGGANWSFIINAQLNSLAVSASGDVAADFVQYGTYINTTAGQWESAQISGSASIGWYTDGPGVIGNYGGNIVAYNSAIGQVENILSGYGVTLFATEGMEQG